MLLKTLSMNTLCLRQVLAHQEALSEFDQSFLDQARSDEANGYIDDALAKYREIFRDVIQEQKNK